MKTLGHIPLAIFCLLHAVNDGPLSRSLKGRLVSYRVETGRQTWKSLTRANCTNDGLVVARS
jgi:hypothetical protein